MLQQGLRLGSVKFGVVCNVLHRHGLSAGGSGGGSSPEVALDGAEAAELLSDIFFATSKLRREKKSLFMNVFARHI